MESPQASGEEHATVVSPPAASTDKQVPPVSMDDTLPAGTVLGDFEVAGLIGDDGFVTVYYAYDRALQREVFLKEYMPSGLAVRRDGALVAKSAQQADAFQAGLHGFLDEARLLARLDHPSLLKVHCFWEANGTAYMVTPCYEGFTLAETLRQRGGDRPNERWLKHLLGHLLEALAVMHKENCFHRNIAPDNILILHDRRPLLLESGAACRAIGDATQNPAIILKPGYAAIEEYPGLTPIKPGAWTDIYALAAVVYFAVMGKVPAPAVARMASDPLVLLEEAASGHFYGPAFLQGIDKALLVKPEERPQCVSEFRSLLELAEPTPEIGPPSAVDTQSVDVPNSSNTPNPPRHHSLKGRPYESEDTSLVALYGIGTIVFLALLAGGWFIVELGQVAPALTMASLEQPQASSGLSVPASIASEVQRPADTSVAKDALSDDSKEKAASRRVTVVKPQAGKKQKSRRRSPVRSGTTNLAKNSALKKDEAKTMKPMPDINGLWTRSDNNSKSKPKSGNSNSSGVKPGNNKSRRAETKLQHMKPMGE
jgi:serine/threonine protein kinase